MAVNIIYTGKDFNAGFRVETEIGFPGSTEKVSVIKLPPDSRISTYSMRNNLRRLYDLNQRNYKDIATLKFEGALSLEMPFYAVDQLKIFMSESEAGSNHFVIPKNNADVKTIGFVIDVPDEDYRYITGFIPESFSISFREEDTVRVSVDGFYNTDGFFTPDTVNGGSVTFNDITGMYLTHIQAEATNLFGVSNWQVKSFNLRVNLNNEAKYGINSRTYQAIVLKGIEGSLDLELVYDSDIVKKFYDGSGSVESPADRVNSVGNLEIKLHDTKNGKTYTITLSDCYIDEVDTPLEPNEEATMTVRLFVGDVTIDVS